jgi:hypothetical protein
MRDLFSRSPSAQLTSGAEKLNVQESNELLDRLFASRDVLATRAYRQLSSQFTNQEHYGRNVRLGMSAAEASRMVDKAG